MFTLGTPNATGVWQVGDSCHKYGYWKMAMTIEKDSLLYLNTDMHLKELTLIDAT